MGGQSHTAGPWSVEAPYTSEVQTSGGLTVASCWYADADGAEITVIGVLPCSVEESAANARLIAAAPDYDAAARKMVDALGYAPDEVIAGAFGGDVLEALNALRAAIAKATGESAA